MAVAGEPQVEWPAGAVVQLRHGMQLGGGRGVVASAGLRAGQLLLVEAPLVPVPADRADDQEPLHAALARALLRGPEWRRHMELCAPLHPITLEEYPAEALQSARDFYAPYVQLILQAAEGEQAGQLAEESVLRLILAMQSNAFYSGIYLQCSMFNHCCVPSCIKLVRPDGRSELRALRNMEAGEECTISYLNPPLLSYQRRARLLLLQHVFNLPEPSLLPTNMEAFFAETGAAQGEYWG
jgi:hypothetical protein